MTRLRAVAALLVVVLLGVAPADARIYRWIDESGTPHFSDRPEDVPARFRQQLEAEEEAAPEGAARFMVVPGLGRPAEGDPAQPVDAAAFEAEALAALQDMQGGQRGLLLQTLKAGAARALPMFLAMLALALLVWCGLGAVLLLVACRICGESSPGFLKGMGIVLLQALAATAVSLLLVLLLGPQPDLGVQASQLGLGVGVQASVLRGLHSESFLRALGVTAVMMLVAAAVAVVLLVATFCAGIGAGLGAG